MTVQVSVPILSVSRFRVLYLTGITRRDFRTAERESHRRRSERRSRRRFVAYLRDAARMRFIYTAMCGGVTRYMCVCICIRWKESESVVKRLAR